MFVNETIDSILVCYVVGMALIGVPLLFYFDAFFKETSIILAILIFYPIVTVLLAIKLIALTVISTLIGLGKVIVMIFRKEK